VEGTAVDLNVSSGAESPAAVVVPGVVGVDRDTASQTLLAAGFVVVVRESASDTVPAGTVMEQRPSGGVMAAAGSTVDIVVSTGPAPAPAPSPTPSPSP
jgi:serine/threonine-protein kinase